MPKASPERVQEWKNLILKQRESGLSIEKWCKGNNIPTHTYHYWREKLFPKTPPLTRMSFTELKDYQDTFLLVECKDTRISLSENFNVATFKRCIQALKEMEC